MHKAVNLIFEKIIFFVILNSKDSYLKEVGSIIYFCKTQIDV